MNWTNLLKNLAIAAIIIVLVVLCLDTNQEVGDAKANEKLLEKKINELEQQLTTERNIRLGINSRIDSANRVSQDLSRVKDSLTFEIKKIKGKYSRYTPSELEVLMEKRYADKN